MTQPTEVRDAAENEAALFSDPTPLTPEIVMQRFPKHQVSSYRYGDRQIYIEIGDIGFSFFVSRTGLVSLSPFVIQTVGDFNKLISALRVEVQS